MATSESWQLFVHNGRHNHKLTVYNHGHAQAARLMERQLQQIEQFRKSHVPPHNILRFLREQDVGCAVRRHIDQNVLAKLTEMVKDEKVAQQFVNGLWKKLINEIDKVEYQRKLEVLKTRWKSRPDFLHYLFSIWLNPFAHKFFRVWTSQVLHFGVETTNRAESEHSVLKVWLSTCHGDLDTVFLNIDSLIQGQIDEIKYTLEISKRKKKYGAKTVDNTPETAITKGRQKTNSTKRDKFHWEFVSITYRKIGKSSGSSSGLRSSSGSGSGPSPRGRGRLPRSGKGKGRGRDSGRSSLSSVVNPNAPSTPFPFNNAFPGFIYKFIPNWKNVVGDGNCGFRVVSNFLFGDENPWVEIRRRMYFDLHHRMNVYVQLFRSVERVTEFIRRTNWEEGSAPAGYWMNTPNHLYVIANTFNLCVIFLARLGSTTVLPLVSNMDGNAGTIFIGFIEEQQHFIQELGGMAGTLVQVSVNKCEDRVGGNTLPMPELSQNKVRHVWLDTVKICKEAVPRGNPASPNLLHPVRHPPNLISCHHIQS
ncbi:hypothetical protein M9H77_12062 [Catharanthus roseus]|uniref:Uncharacterized protein n=1 Tax=Catharanthus roseus TaxID=4058 RepID=A0ACC0BGI2_CATRO|nr:hypothetical protein M9H77_12062 [Catharanthus roseus]